MKILSAGIFLILALITQPVVADVDGPIHNNRDLSFQNPQKMINNFGMVGLLDLPTAESLPDGELVFYQRNNGTLSRSGSSFQVTPRIGFSFRYSGHGENGNEAFGRLNHDRSFDLHFNVLKQTKNRPSISFGLRDLVGTGWYSSEYIVGTKVVGRLGLTAGLGFGRLAGRNQITNPLSKIDGYFESRSANETGRGGTLGTINWFRGPASPFGGVSYFANDKLSLALEYSPDLMNRESSYLEVKSPYNFGLSYSLNDNVSFVANYLYGSTVTIGANIQLNPKRAPNGNGKDMAPVPMRKRVIDGGGRIKTNIGAIKSVLEADGFLLKKTLVQVDSIHVEVENTKFRSTAQSLGRIITTLQRFSGDQVDYAIVTFSESAFPLTSYRVDLQRIGDYQNGLNDISEFEMVVVPVDLPDWEPDIIPEVAKRLTWGLGPYFDYKLFDPLKPIRAEVGLALGIDYDLSKKLKISSSFKKSLITDLDEVKRQSDSELPHVLSDFALYDQAGQPGHLDHLTLTYFSKISTNVFSKVALGYLEPMYAGVVGELLYKSPTSNFAFGVDLNAVQMRDFNMRLGLRDYQTVSGHLSLYYDSGGPFDLAVHAGRYLAKDWGVTTNISRRFNNGWSVGAYATITDVPFDKFGEGSFDKGFYLDIPLDWMTGSPTKSERRVNIRPITRDGGAILGASKTLYGVTSSTQKSEIKREYGRMWK
jgi:hypothetical protein